MSDLVSIAEVWRDRARVAEQAASDLDGLVESASNVLLRNYFGTGCSEGLALFNNLKMVLDSWCGEVSGLAGALAGTADRCQKAADTYAAADQSVADEMGG